VHALLGADGLGERDSFELAFTKHLRRLKTNSSVDDGQHRAASADEQKNY
jgi:hypothetical protein